MPQGLQTRQQSRNGDRRGLYPIGLFRARLAGANLRGADLSVAACPHGGRAQDAAPWLSRSSTRAASASMAKGLTSTCMPGSRWPWLSTAVSA